MIKSTLIACLLMLILQVFESDAHGRLLVPPARSSAWREDPARFPAYYDDAQMFCGGFQKQWGVNGMRKQKRYGNKKLSDFFLKKFFCFSLNSRRFMWHLW